MGQFLYFLLHTIRIYSHGVEMSCFLSDLNKHEAGFSQVLGDCPSHTQKFHRFLQDIHPISTCKPVWGLHLSQSLLYSGFLCCGAKISQGNILTGRSNYSIIILHSYLTNDELWSKSWSYFRFLLCCAGIFHQYC